MISRRAFIQGTMGAATAALALPAFATTSQTRVLRIDSVETPHFDGGIRLSGSHLERFARLRDSLNGPARVEAHLDGTGQVLLDTVLNASNLRVGSVTHEAGCLIFTLAG